MWHDFIICPLCIVHHATTQADDAGMDRLKGSMVQAAIKRLIKEFKSKVSQVVNSRALFLLVLLRNMVLVLFIFFFPSPNKENKTFFSEVKRLTTMTTIFLWI